MAMTSAAHLVALSAVASTVPSSGDAPASASAARRSRRSRPVFHVLRGASVERLCEDAIAITFDVPEYVSCRACVEPFEHVKEF